MSKTRKRIKFDYRHIICIAVSIGFICIAIFCFPLALRRLGEAFRDLWLSLKFYFCELLEIEHEIEPTVGNYSSLPLKLPFNLPETWEEFKVAWSHYWATFANIDNFRMYWDAVGTVVLQGSRWLVLILPLVVLLWFVLVKLVQSHNNNYGQETRPLKIFKRLMDKTYRPAKKWVFSFIDFMKGHRFYLWIWFWTMAYAFSWITIVVAFFAFYFYFVVSFQFSTIYVQVVKLFYDLGAMIDFVPVPVWVILGYWIFDIIRKKIALARLHHFEMMNRGFINERPIVFLTVGTMGKKKTTLITDMALSLEVMFRDQSLEKIYEADMKFPYFPWIVFENSLRRAMEDHRVFNLVTCETWVRGRQAFFENYIKIREPYPYEKVNAERYIFGYDFKRYGMTYDNAMYIEYLWDVLETYAKLFFIYIVQGSLLMSNYSIRTDSIINDGGNFAYWDTDFFSRESASVDTDSKHAHILDFDMLRLGRKVLEYNAKENAFEFGGVVITEIGKERGNALELQELKKKTAETNQKNDLFNAWIKLVRHSATVDNFPFVKVLTDEQRPESWGADARQLCEIVHIDDCSEMSLAMPFYHLGELLHDFFFGKFIDKYSEYRYHHGDTTLSMYLLKSVISCFHNRHTRLYNRFGFMKVNLQVEKGTQDGMVKESSYFLMPKKIYSRRFSTDAFAEYFNEKALRSALGIEDLQSYETEKATMEELRQQNSYWINDLEKIRQDEGEE